jgi:Zn-dependent protease
MSQFFTATEGPRSAMTVCPHCGQVISADALVCPSCGLFVHLPELQELSQQAQALEAQDPRAAAAIWRRTLELVPAESPQAEMVRRRIAVLESARVTSTGYGWQSALARTGGSMLVSILVYAIFLGPSFAAGFVILILVHEMGHVLALRRYGIRSTPPLFIPFVGAVITVPRMRDAKEEAIVGIGGPVLGTAGALACFTIWWFWFRARGDDLLLVLSYFGFMLNALNMLPIPPLDGGRVTAAVSPWIWPLGLIAFVALLVTGILPLGPVPILIVVFSAPRLWRTFRNSQERNSPYYKIGREASVAIGVAYVLLTALLLGMFLYTQHLTRGML